jgi:hypothetical protein
VFEIGQSRITWAISPLPSRQQQVTPGCHTGAVMAYGGEWHEPPLVWTAPSAVDVRYELLQEFLQTEIQNVLIVCGHQRFQNSIIKLKLEYRYLSKGSTERIVNYVTINDIQIPRKTQIKYLGMTIDSKLTWKQHIAKKRKQVNITIKQLNWLLGRK